MNPREFLLFAGMALLLLGVIGYVRPGGQILGDMWYLTPGENVAHLTFGLVALVSMCVLDDKLQRMFVQIVAVVALFFAVYGFFVAGVPPMNAFGIANLEAPYDNMLHLIVGVWAAYVGWAQK